MRANNMASKRSGIFTIGYEGRELSEFVALLASKRITRVIDVRALPLSRRRGFSKTRLREALASSGIDYVHLRAAGNPYRAYKADLARCLAMYRGHLDRSPDVITLVADAAHGHRAALLCVEREACDCHRSIIASRLHARTRETVADL